MGNDFAALFNSQEMSDYTLESSDGQKFPVHKCILAARCKALLEASATGSFVILLLSFVKTSRNSWRRATESFGPICLHWNCRKAFVVRYG